MINSVCNIDSVVQWISLWLHRRARVDIFDVSRVGVYRFAKQAILYESFLMISHFFFIQNCIHLVTPLRWASMLDWSKVCMSLGARNSWNHRILNVIVFFPGSEVIFVHLLLYVGHVSVRSQSLLLIDLAAETLSVHLDSLVLLVLSLLVKLVVEDSNTLGIGCIILTCRSIDGLLWSHVRVDLSH